MNFHPTYGLFAFLPGALLAQATAPRAASANQEALRLDPVVVTAARTQQPLVVAADPRAPAQPVPAHDGADVLKGVPGFAVIRKGGTDGDPVLRGLAGSRLGVQIDGEYIYGGCGNRMDPPTAYVFPAAYDRITVIKGPQTVLHGPGNTAGVVLFERNPRRPAAPEAALETAATAASFGRLDGLLDARAGNAITQVRATGTVTRSGDYADGAGRAVHSAYRRWSANASLAWTPDDRTTLEVSGARSDGEAAYADRTMDGVKFDRSNLGLRIRRDRLSPLVTAAEARFYRNHVDHVMDNFSLRSFTPSTAMPGRSVANPDRFTTGGQVQLTLTPVEALSATLGADTQRNVHTIRSTMNEAVQPYEPMARARDAEFNQYGIFGQGTWTLATGSRIVAGTRFDRWQAQDSRAGISIPMTGLVPNPSARRVRRSGLASGFVRYEHELPAAPGPATWFAGLGRVQRFPDYWELIKNEGAGSVSAFGSKPETATQFDVGVLSRRGSLDWSVSLFAAEFADYLLVQGNVAKPAGMTGSRRAVITRNVDAATLGGEAALSWRPAEHWKADASVAWVRGDNKTDAVPLAQLPPLEGRFALARATAAWSVGGLLRLVAPQDRFAVDQGNIVGQDLGRSPGFAVVSLNASRKVWRHYRLSAGIDNLLNHAYAEHISRAGSAVAGFTQATRVNEPGRTLWLKLDAVF